MKIHAVEGALIPTDKQKDGGTEVWTVKNTDVTEAIIHVLLIKIEDY